MIFAQKQWGWLTLAFICLSASTTFSLVIPKMLGKGIDTVLSSGERGMLLIAALAVIGASALRGISAYGNSYLSELVSQKTAYDIRNALYDRLQRLSFAYHDKTQTGQLMSRATADVEAIRASGHVVEPEGAIGSRLDRLTLRQPEEARSVGLQHQQRHYRAEQQ
jgi:ABC-type multidrug transport system fused ATPase/permease subunit